MPISNYPTEGMKEEARRGLAWRKEFDEVVLGLDK